MNQICWKLIENEIKRSKKTNWERAKRSETNKTEYVHVHVYVYCLVSLSAFIQVLHKVSLHSFIKYMYTLYQNLYYFFFFL